MKQLMKNSPSVMRAFTLCISLFITVFSTATYSEDIEIYQGTIDDGSQETEALLNPNVLFIMDTSGSMGTVESTPATLGNYDPDVDYGEDNAANGDDAADDAYIYVYDTNLQYTGHYITVDQNVCNTMTTFHAANPSYPLYLDRGLQWQSGDQDVTQEVCTDTPTTNNFNGNDSISGNNQWELVLGQNLTDADSYSATISTTGRANIYVYERRANGSWRRICRRNLSNNDTETCSGSITSGSTRLEIWIRNRIGGTNNYTYDVDINQVNTTCTDETTTINVTEWTEDILTSTDDGWVLECGNDAGNHGLTDTSTMRYPRWCGTNNTCANPSYTSSTANDINYHSSGVDQKFFVTGNYHDYIQSFAHPDPASLSTQNGNTYCNSTTVGDVFIDSNSQIIMTCLRRIEIMKQSLNNLISSLTNVNVGLMRFNENGQGGTVIYDINDINDDTVRTNFLSEVSSLNANGVTPLSESLYESYRYYAGLSKNYGYANGSGATQTDPAAMDGSNYETPILNHCQNNNIVLLTDGEPVSDTGANSAIGTLHGSSCSGNCLDEMAGYMADNDVNGDIQNDNNVFTYTIGLDIDLQLLQDTADAGAPPYADSSGYYIANDTLGLESAFRQIIANIQTVSSDTFVAPAVSVNAFNRLQHRTDLYFAIFKPNNTPRWNGNIKKYGVQSDATIIDANGDDAIDPITGFFRAGAQSIWSDEVDGPIVERGGFAGELTNDRTLYGNIPDPDNAGDFIDVSLTNEDTGKTAIENFVDQTAAIDIGQAGITQTELDQSRETIARWTIGEDVDQELGGDADDPNKFAGESLHGTPYVLSYGTSDVTPNDVIFVTTNQGILHAVNGIDGTERWAYIPDEDLYKNLGEYYYNEVQDEHVYGLDGEISFIVERDSDFEITRANLYLGQRRGGSKYFAIDVTDGYSTTEDPVANIWTIEGGIANTDFERMGQSWAKPVPTHINYCVSGTCGLREVLIISGGYDTQYDEYTDINGDLVDVSSFAGNVLGNAIYIVDAANGNLLWMASSDVVDTDRDLELSGMDHGFPSPPTALDMNSDGAIDMMFAVDIAGRIWRFDFKADEGRYQRYRRH